MTVSQEARERLGKPSIYDPGRFGVAIDYDRALAAIQSVIDEREAARKLVAEARTVLEPFAESYNSTIEEAHRAIQFGAYIPTGDNDSTEGIINFKMVELRRAANLHTRMGE